MSVVPKNAHAHSTALLDTRKKTPLPNYSPMSPSYSTEFSGKVRLNVPPVLLFLIFMTASCKKELPFFFFRVL